MWETNSSFRCTAAPFFGRRPLPGLRGPGFSNAVQDFFALVTISMRTSPLPLSSLSFSSAGTVRKYLSGRSRESPKVRAAREASSTICITWEAAETEASFHSPAAFRPSWSRILKGMHAQPQTLSARMPRRRTYARGCTPALLNFRILGRVSLPLASMSFFGRLHTVSYKDMEVVFLIKRGVLFYSRELAKAHVF